MTVFRVTAKHEVTKRVLREETFVGSEDEAEIIADGWMGVFPDADVSYVEVEEELGSVKLEGHPLHGAKVSLVSNEKGMAVVRLLERRGAFRSGNIMSFGQSDVCFK